MLDGRTQRARNHDRRKRGEGKELSIHPKLNFETAIQSPSHNWAPFLFCGTQFNAIISHPKRTAGFVDFGCIAHVALARLIPFGFTQRLYFSYPSFPGKLS